MISDAFGIVSGRTSLDDLEDILVRVGARKDVYLAFVLKWDTSTDIDSWMIEPNGTAIGYSTPYKGVVAGTRGYNYVLDALETKVDMNSSLLTSNKGNLDKDCIECSVPSIENLVYFDKDYMEDGTYQYKIDDYSGDHARGFTVYIIERNAQLEAIAFAQLVWRGRFSHPRAMSAAQTMIKFDKRGNSLMFTKVHPYLELVHSEGFIWS